MEAGYRGSKNLEKLCELIDCEVSLADEGSQCAWLQFFSSRGNAKVVPIGMISVSILRGSPSAFRSLRQQRISCDTSSGVSSRRGISCFSRRARIPSIASRILAMASSRVSPWLTQPGRAGQWMEYPMLSGSRITVNFIRNLRSHSIAMGN